VTDTRVDLHVKVLDERVVERAKARGIDVLVYAPHFTRLPAIRRRAESFSDDELAVVPAREVFTGTWHNRKHVLAVGLSEPVPDFIPLETAVREFERQGAAILVPHPGFLNVSLSRPDIDAYRASIDAVETYNPKHLPRDNRRARAIAADLDIPAFASSYAHLRKTVGEVWTRFEREITSADGLVSALKEGAERGVGHYDGPLHAARRVAEFAHLGWENTYGKLDRVLLSGTEPTHPRHIAYEGRFEDAALY
jgi:predicted metal-dependent phosphoesterase TrpH